MLLRAAVLLMLVAGCKPKSPVSPADLLPVKQALQAASARPVPNPIAGRFGIRIQSKPLGIGGSTVGGLVIDRPGKLHFSINTPFGTPVFTVTSDGERVGVYNGQDKLYVLGQDAALKLSEASGGAVGMDDIIGLFLGLLPLDPSTIEHGELVEGAVHVRAIGPGDTRVEARLDPVLGTPQRVAVFGAMADTPAVIAEYEAFEPYGDGVMPSRVTVLVPAYEATLDLRFRSWKEGTPPEGVFVVAAPKGMAVLDFEAYGALMADKLREARGEEVAPEPAP